MSCDRVIIASPLYFSMLTGSLMNVMSRLQMVFMQKYIKKQPLPIPPKKGLVLISGGGSTKNTVGVEQICRILMMDFNVTEFETVMYINTDECSVLEDEQSLKALDKAKKFFIN
jgi:multimeric flavodoxin WrbA